MPIQLAIQAMGTRFELVLDGGDDVRLRAAGEAALDEIRQCHDLYNLFDPGSWLNVINRRAAHEPVELDGWTWDLLQTCRQVYGASNGAFDVTVGPLMRAWGFHGPKRIERVAQVPCCVGMSEVELNADTRSVHFRKQGMMLDLGGIAKGFAIDRAIDVLREVGVECALLHGGTSTVATIGTPPGRDGWRVGIHPHGCLTPNESIAKYDTGPIVCLKDQALSVSAPHGRTRELDGETLGHVLDPRSEQPARCGAFAAAVGASACLTDAWSTALLVLGEPPALMPDTIQAIFPNHTPANPILEDVSV